MLRHTKVNPGDHAYSWKILLSGYAPLYAYERGRLDTSLPFDELKRRAYVNGPAQAADQAPNFSQRIRADLTTVAGSALPSDPNPVGACPGFDERNPRRAAQGGPPGARARAAGGRGRRQSGCRGP